MAPSFDIALKVQGFMSAKTIGFVSINMKRYMPWLEKREAFEIKKQVYFVKLDGSLKDEIEGNLRVWGEGLLALAVVSGPLLCEVQRFADKGELF